MDLAGHELNINHSTPHRSQYDVTIGFFPADSFFLPVARGPHKGQFFVWG
jgi:hypothetical protein